MSITRLNHFEAKPGRGGDLRRFLEQVIDVIRLADGCRSCELLESTDVPEKLAIVEVWDNVASHRAAANRITPAQLQEAMALMAGPPSGAYYVVVKS
ncbi:MAG: antibiotic biosynthesis monooxygenase [Acidobacteria bacterium]|nr:antibiotic biosynthesis monooxygenase [Acidobacteriota bacterium]